MYDRKLIRLTGFDYSSSRYHFFTICVEDHYHSFGAIENKTMILSYQGNIAFEQWKWLGKQYPYIDLISFVIMPDSTIQPDRRIQSNRTIKSIPKIKPLPELIGAYKATVSKRIHQAGDKMFKWQKSYHDHIIRNMRSLNIIKKYIRKNPEKWEL